MRKGDMVAVMYAIGPDRRGTTDRSAVLLRGGDAGTDPRGCPRHGGDARGSHGVQSRNPGGGRVGHYTVFSLLWRALAVAMPSCLSLFLAITLFVSSSPAFMITSN